jgi:hypothetical protein
MEIHQNLHEEDQLPLQHLEQLQELLNQLLQPHDKQPDQQYQLQLKAFHQ